ncbi:hypothetical protein BH11PLA2_BH11PLA2_11450 [soil metagenome]
MQPDQASDATAMPFPNAERKAKPAFRQAWVTFAACVACIIVHIGLTSAPNPESWETLTKWGYAPANVIRDGNYWPLLTSNFVHLALWHLVFNVLCLWQFGSRMERRIGSRWYLAFVLVAACLCSSYQLATLDDTGIGISGVVYAIFGFMLVVRHRVPEFRAILPKNTVIFFVGWLFACVVLTQMKILNVGNASHFSGFLFGCLASAVFVARYLLAITVPALVITIVLAIVPLFWCPWSVSWLSHRAYQVHQAQQYHKAIDLYSQIIALDPANAWAYYNRSGLYSLTGETLKAESDYERALKIDPNIEVAQ